MGDAPFLKQINSYKWLTETSGDITAKPVAGRDRLARRKNKDCGSLLIRQCSCASVAATCPVHVLGRFIDSLPAGCCPFACVSRRRLTEDLRLHLSLIGISDVGEYSSKVFRRGHAQDMLARGVDLRDILAAGEWTSSAVCRYTEHGDAELEAGLVLRTHLDESSDGDRGKPAAVVVPGGKPAAGRPRVAATLPRQTGTRRSGVAKPRRAAIRAQ